MSCIHIHPIPLHTSTYYTSLHINTDGYTQSYTNTYKHIPPIHTHAHTNRYYSGIHIVTNTYRYTQSHTNIYKHTQSPIQTCTQKHTSIGTCNRHLKTHIHIHTNTYTYMKTYKYNIHKHIHI